MSAPGFAARLAYVRWLRNRGQLRAETDAELAEATGVGLPWLTKWKARDDAPNDRAITKRFAAGLGVSDDWLIDGRGDAPEPALWRMWLAFDGGGGDGGLDPPDYMKAAAKHGLDVAMSGLPAKPRRKRAAGDDDRRRNH